MGAADMLWNARGTAPVRLGGVHRMPRCSRGRIRAGVAMAFSLWGWEWPRGPAKEPVPPQGPRRLQFMSYVGDVQPLVVDQFLLERSDDEEVKSAILQMSHNVVGSLDSDDFEVIIGASGDKIAEQFYRALLHSYILRSAQISRDLQVAADLDSDLLVGAGSFAANGEWAGGVGERMKAAPLEQEAITLLPMEVLGAGAGGGSTYAHPFLDDSLYAPGVQTTRVQGEVLRWDVKQQRAVTFPAGDYIQFLQQQLAVMSLTHQLITPRRVPGAPPSSPQGFEVLEASQALSPPAPPAPAAAKKPLAVPFVRIAAKDKVELDAAAVGRALGQGAGSCFGAGVLSGQHNELLDYIKQLPQHSKNSLAAGMSRDVQDAMFVFVSRMMGEADHRKLPHLKADFTGGQLQRQLIWLMIVGYTLRTMEDRFDREDALEAQFGMQAPPVLSGGDDEEAL